MKTLLIPFICLVLIYAQPPASCQTGPEKDFLSLKRETFGGSVTVYYHSRYSRMAQRIAGIADEFSGDIASELGLGSVDSYEIYLASNRKEYMALVGGRIPEWSEACADSRRGRICVNAGAVLMSPRPLKIVIKHELSHLFIAQRVEGTRCPRWFLEGVAMRQSGEWTFSDQWRLQLSLWRKDVPGLRELDAGFPRWGSDAKLAYGISYIAVSELFAQRPGDLATLTAFARDTEDFGEAFYLTFAKSQSDFAEEFRVILNKKYRKRGVLLAASPFWAAAGLFFLGIYILKMRRSKKKIEQWEEEEAISKASSSPGAERPDNDRW